jgi:hypothetical protein
MDPLINWHESLANTRRRQAALARVALGVGKLSRDCHGWNAITLGQSYS